MGTRRNCLGEGEINPKTDPIRIKEAPNIEKNAQSGEKCSKKAPTLEKNLQKISQIEKIFGGRFSERGGERLLLIPPYNNPP